MIVTTPIHPAGTRCLCSDLRPHPCVVEGHEIHNNVLYHKVKWLLPNGEFFGGGIVTGDRLTPVGEG